MNHGEECPANVASDGGVSTSTSGIKKRMSCRMRGWGDEMRWRRRRRRRGRGDGEE